MNAGIEAINCYVGSTKIGVADIFQARQLDMQRMSNLMMRDKSVNLPIEDPVTNGVNAAKPIINALSEEEKNSIEYVIIGSESGIDFGKSLSTYIAHYLNLPKRCRSFEVKHACYGGTAALQSAVAMVNSNPRHNVKALVLAADTSSVAARNTYWEPSQGAGAVAMLVSRNAKTLALDTGANGYYSFEVMDTLRPRPDMESGDSDLSIMSYMKCLNESFKHYSELVHDADLRHSFSHLVLHSPFAGMVKSAHQRLFTKSYGASTSLVEEDFHQRVSPALSFCQQVGNIYSASVYLGLCSLLQNADIQGKQRIGVFSYGSGCASEFYSGVVSEDAQKRFKQLKVDEQLVARRKLTLGEYDTISDLCMQRIAGVQDLKPDTVAYDHILASHFEGKGLLVLDRIENFHRKYRFM